MDHTNQENLKVQQILISKNHHINHKKKENYIVSNKLTEDKKTGGGIGVFIILLLFLLGFAYTLNNDIIPQRSAMHDANEFFSTFNYLIEGNTNAFLNNIEASISFLGLFIILFTILYFLFTTVLSFIFKTKATALIMASVITIYSFLNNTAYNYLISLNAFAIGLMVFILVVLIMWRTSKDWYGEAKKSNQERREVQDAYDEAKQKYIDLKNEI